MTVTKALYTVRGKVRVLALGEMGGGEALESVFKARKPKALVSRKWTRNVTFDKRFSYDGLELGPD